LVHINGSQFIFLLGAGASVNAGLHTAFQLTEKFKEEIISTGDDSLRRALAFVLGGIHMYHGQSGQLPQKEINVEELATMLDMMRSRHKNQLSPYVGAWNEMLGQFDGSRIQRDLNEANRSVSRNLLQELSDTLQHNIKEWLATPATSQLRYLELFGDFTMKYGNIDIFTLNYDLCVETALSNRGVGFTCGFTSRGWDTKQFLQNDFQVRLYKLHGSLDWYRDEEDRMIYSLQTPPEDREPANNNLPLLIFGLVNKLQPIDPYLYLSYTFSEKVKSCNVVVLIGYGFGDEHINQILWQGLSRDPRQRLLVVGHKEESTLSSFERLFDPEKVLISAKRVDFLFGGAKQALEDQSLLNKLEESLTEATDEGPF
jgi:hypothetical protein